MGHLKKRNSSERHISFGKSPGLFRKTFNTGIEANLTNNKLIEENDYKQDPSYYSYNKRIIYLRLILLIHHLGFQTAPNIC